MIPVAMDPVVNLQYLLHGKDWRLLLEDGQTVARSVLMEVILVVARTPPLSAVLRAVSTSEDINL